MQLSRWIDNLRGAGEILFNLLTPWRRQDRTTWGATAEEVARIYRGDDLVQHGSWGYTHAITIDVPPSRVWPWLVQLGQGRAGFYSFELLENLVGCKIRNSESILPDFQHLDVGDLVRLAPRFPPPLVVSIIETDRCLALLGLAPDGTGEPVSLWAFHLFETDVGSTRLIERGRYVVGRSRSARLSLGPTILEPISFVMSRQMLRTIARLARTRE